VSECAARIPHVPLCWAWRDVSLWSLCINAQNRWRRRRRCGGWCQHPARSLGVAAADSACVCFVQNLIKSDTTPTTPCSTGGNKQRELLCFFVCCFNWLRRRRSGLRARSMGSSNGISQKGQGSLSVSLWWDMIEQEIKFKCGRAFVLVSRLVVQTKCSKFTEEA
jgi:hypothetical protein